MGSKAWALSVSAKKVERDRTITVNTAGAVQADSEEEALGRGLKMAQKQWPQADDWQEHSCVACKIPDAWFSPSPTASGDRPTAQRVDGRTITDRGRSAFARIGRQRLQEASYGV